MPTAQTGQPILRCPRTDIDGTEPFDNDLLERKNLALKLTDYLDRLKEGSVLAIDAPWGEGKTWFGKNWAQHLNQESHKVVYIDAFERDYIEDPFMLLTSEILDVIDDENEAEESLKKSGAKIAKALLPMAIKASINFGGRILLGYSDVSGEIQDTIEAGTDDASELTSEWIKDKLDGYIQDKVVIQEFKDRLKEYAQSQDKPIVIFIDELDRCKPTFAVSLIERIKHFFDVPNIVFVLLLNRDQLEKAVKGVYGSETDASTYLGKFIHFFFMLPKPVLSDINAEQKYKKYILTTFRKYQFESSSESDVFIKHLMFWAPRYDLSLRDIEKAIAMYAFAQPIYELSFLLTYVIVLKVKRNELFQQLLKDNKQAHIEAKKFIDILMDDEERRGNSQAQRVLCLPQKWHESHINNFIDIDACISSVMQETHLYEIRSLFRSLAKQIELEIEG